MVLGKKWDGALEPVAYRGVGPVAGIIRETIASASGSFLFFLHSTMPVLCFLLSVHAVIASTGLYTPPEHDNGQLVLALQANS